MIRGIDMSVVMKNIDEAAKVMKNKEASLLMQQAHANVELIEESKIKQESVTKTNETHMDRIDVNRRERYIVDEKKKKEKEEEQKKKKERKKSKDLNKGRWLDIEI